MNAQQLYDLVSPVLEKHPRTVPSNLVFLRDRGAWHHQYDEWVSAKMASLVFTGHFMALLSSTDVDLVVETFFRQREEEWVVRIVFYDTVKYYGGPTLLHALCKALLDIPPNYLDLV